MGIKRQSRKEALDNLDKAMERWYQEQTRKAQALGDEQKQADIKTVNNHMVKITRRLHRIVNLTEKDKWRISRKDI